MKKFLAFIFCICFCCSLLGSGLSIFAEEDYADAAEIYIPDDGMATAPIVMKKMDSAQDIEALGEEERPACALFEVDQSMNVLDQNGQGIGTAEDIWNRFSEKVVPAFYAGNAEEGTAITDFLLEKNAIDALIVSSDTETLKASYEQAPMIGRVWDCILENEPGGLDQQLLYDIHTKVSASHAKIVLLDAAYAVKSNTEYLQRLADSVWFRADTETNTEICTMITAGANGILVQDETQAYKIFSFLGNNAVTRKIFVIGHRGLPSSVPENTTEGAVAAAKAGATHVECDIHLTADGSVVVCHNDTTGAMYNQDLIIEESTLSDLKSLQLKEPTVGYEDCRMPEFTEYLSALKSTSANIFIEIKSKQNRCVDEAVKIIKQLGMQDRVYFISFYSEQLAYLHTAYPEFSGGYLADVPTGIGPESIVKQSLLRLRKDNFTCNPSQSGCTDIFMTYMAARGITVWPWTVNNLDDFISLFNAGASGITTDHADWVSDFVADLSSPSSYVFEYRSGTVGNISVTATTYDGTQTQVVPKMKIIDDDGTSIKMDESGNISASKAGTATVLFEYSQKYKEEGTRSYSVFTQPVTIELKADMSLWIIGGVVGGCLVVAAVVTVVVVKTRKKKTDPIESQK